MAGRENRVWRERVSTQALLQASVVSDIMCCCFWYHSVLVFADESVRDATDVMRLADADVVHGVNVKLEKAAG